MSQLLSFLLKLDEHLEKLTHDYGTWTYAILFAIIFCETGLVVTPFLPGDSLLFAIGAFAARPESGLNFLTLGTLLSIAAILGDTANYHLGKIVGPKVLSGKYIRWLNVNHLHKTQEFFERHGGKTIIIARFVPIIRTFAPFVAGIGSMNYARFFAFNIIGGLVWVWGILGAGFFFGNIPVVKKNFELVVIGIIAVSLLPIAFEFIMHRLKKSPASQDAS